MWAVSLIVSILITGSGPQTRACLQAPENPMEGISLQTPIAGGAFPPTGVRGSPQILTTSSLLYFTEAKLTLKFHFQRCFLDHFYEEESEPRNGPWRSLGNSQRRRLRSGAGGVCACVPVTGGRGDTVTIRKSQTTGLFEVRQGLCTHTETDRA